jgi:hypothetical protein
MRKANSVTAPFIVSRIDRLLAVEHDAAGLWRALERGELAPPPAPGIHALAVWRGGFDVFHTGLDLEEATALEGVAAGDPLSRVCAAFAGCEDAAQAAFAAITSWFHEGWIAALEPPADRLSACSPEREGPRRGGAR